MDPLPPASAAPARTAERTDLRRRDTPAFAELLHGVGTADLSLETYVAWLIDRAESATQEKAR